MTVRIGVLSDLHCELEPAGSRWINVFEPEHLDRAHRRGARVVRRSAGGAGRPARRQRPIRESERSRARVRPAGGGERRPGGDGRTGTTTSAWARSSRLRTRERDRAAVRGAGGARRGPRRRRRGQSGPGAAAVRRPGPETRRATPGLVVVASHFPVLSEATRVAAAGLPYAGDLVNRTRARGRAAVGPAAEGRAQRAHPRALLDPRGAVAAVHRRGPDRAAVRRDDRRDRRDARPADGAPPR